MCEHEETDAFNFKDAAGVLFVLLQTHHQELDPCTREKLNSLCLTLIRVDQEQARGRQLTKEYRWELLSQFTHILQSMSTVVDAVSRWIA